jgi:hypothetical protein
MVVSGESDKGIDIIAVTVIFGEVVQRKGNVRLVK